MILAELNENQGNNGNKSKKDNERQKWTPVEKKPNEK